MLNRYSIINDQIVRCYMKTRIELIAGLFEALVVKINLRRDERLETFGTFKTERRNDQIQLYVTLSGR